MNILVICQYYHPEPVRISDICEELVKEGHQVTVVTGTPNYPMGYIYDGYEKGQKADEIINGVKVHRCNIIPRKQSIFFRFLNYYSFPASSLKYIKSLDNSFDVVFINQLSPVLMAKAGIKYAKKHNKKALLYCLDLWPASISAGNISEKNLIGKLIYKWFYMESKKIYCNADRILATSKSFFKYFKEKFDIEGTGYLPQYAEDNFDIKECEKENDEYIDLMFAGNIGTAQSIDVIIRASHMCKDIENLRWHIVGEGKELERLKKMSANMEVPVTFYGRKPLSDMPKYYKMADAMLVTMQKDEVLNLTLPGKVQSYLASGKPIIGAVNGETKELVEEFGLGFCAPSDDAQQLADAVRKFCALSTEEKDQIKKNAINCYNSQFRKSIFMEKLISELELIKR